MAGISVTRDARVDSAQRNEDPGDTIKRVMATNRATKLIFCLLPNFDNKHIYNSIKEASELEMGVLTQCMVNKWRLGQGESGGGRGGGRDGGRGGRGGRGGGGGPNDQYYVNVMQKVNAKLGGINALASPRMSPSRQPTRLMSVPTLVFGADVSHASPVGVRM